MSHSSEEESMNELTVFGEEHAGEDRNHDDDDDDDDYIYEDAAEDYNDEEEEEAEEEDEDEEAERHNRPGRHLFGNFEVEVTYEDSEDEDEDENEDGDDENLLFDLDQDGDRTAVLLHRKFSLIMACITFSLSLHSFASFPPQMNGATLTLDGHLVYLWLCLVLAMLQQGRTPAMLRSGRRRENSPLPEPNTEKGNELLNSGEFGRVDSALFPPPILQHSRKRHHEGGSDILDVDVCAGLRKGLGRKLWLREINPRAVNPVTIAESLLPDNPGKVIAAYEDSAYSGQYSEDGSLFASCDQGWNLRIYRTAGNKLIREKTIRGTPGQWTITDHTLSLDNDWLIYSSITPYVYLTRTALDAPDTQHQLDFSTDKDNEGLWSIRFSGDGKEIVAGGRNRIYVYDIESRTVLHAVEGHMDDVNSVCFAEPTSSQVVFSGSDDTTVKVWDRRSMNASGSGTPSGVLVGHAEGITYVTSKGDNRYLASNGKDQKMLLWDLRMMHSSRNSARWRRSRTNFDYRMDDYGVSKRNKVKGDCSVMTFQGHKVLKTLIRCHFSPAHSTGQRYLYTGSADGNVAIYRLDGTRVRTLDTNAAFQTYSKRVRRSEYIARDVSWHPFYPTIITSCRTDSYFQSRSASDIPGGLVRHTFQSPMDMESEVSEHSDSDERNELPTRPRQRRRF